MIQNRKSLLDSINPEASAFLQEGNPKAKQEKPKKIEKEEEQVLSRLSEEMTAKHTAPVLKPVTFMLSSDLVDEIMLLSAKRKIIKQKPYSQKDILTEALRDWIDKNK
jgi:hypothetical protein